jgi:hypothetical protein
MESQRLEDKYYNTIEGQLSNSESRVHMVLLLFIPFLWEMSVMHQTSQLR